MKTILYISLVILTGYASTAEAYDWPPDINLKAIYFNYTSGDTSDGIALKHHHTSEIYPPEWTVSSSDTVAYVKSRQVNLKATIECNEGDITTIDLYPSDPGPTRLGTFQETAFGFASADTATVVINRSSGNVPTSVGDKTTWMVWYVSSINGTPITDHQIAYTNNNYYVVYDTPLAPMDKPWARVLAYSCDWAIYETTAVGCATEVAEGIYSDLGDTDGDIDYGNHGYSYHRSGEGEAQTNFDLSDFLNDIITISDMQICCHDTGCLFNIFSAALGIDSATMALWYIDNFTHDTTPFGYNELDPLGDDRGWITSTWCVHQFGIVENEYVYDACIRLNQPPAYVPTNIDTTTYKERLIRFEPNNAVYHSIISQTQIVDY